MKSTKKSLIASGISLAVSMALMVGSTFAWFTDSVTNKGNTIQAGKLDVGFEYRDLTDTQPEDYTAMPENSADAGALFTQNQIWEPGYSFGYDFRVSNSGTLAFDWTLTFDNMKSTDGVPGDNIDADIADVIDVYIVAADKNDLTGATPAGTLSELSEIKGGTLVKDAASEEFSVILKMQEEAGNEYQNGSVTFDVYLRAKQATVEADGFGNTDYDKDATYEQIVVEVGGDPAENGEALKEAIENIADGGTVFVPAGEYQIPDMVLTDKEFVLQGEDGTSFDNITFTQTKNSKITVRDVDFAAEAGSGILGITLTDNGNAGNSLVVENCTFDGLQTGIYLGGVINAEIKNCSFTNCVAGIGGSESITETLLVDSCEFASNEENIGWAGSGELIITNSPTCDSYADYTDGKKGEEVTAYIAASSETELQNALNNIGTSGTVELTGDISIDSLSVSNYKGLLCITGKENVILDGNGHTITVTKDCGKDTDVLAIAGAKNVTVKDIIIKSTNSDQNNRPGYAINAYEAINLTLENVTVSNMIKLGLFANASTVKLTGDFTLGDNLGWGNYINVAWGSGIGSNGGYGAKLDASEANLTGVDYVLIDSNVPTEAGGKGGYEVKMPDGWSEKNTDYGIVWSKQP